MNQECIAKDCCGEEQRDAKYLKILEAVYHLADARFNLQQLFDDIVGVPEKEKKESVASSSVWNSKYIRDRLSTSDSPTGVLTSVPSLLSVINDTPTRIYDEAKQINSIISDIRGAIL